MATTQDVGATNGAGTGYNNKENFSGTDRLDHGNNGAPLTHTDTNQSARLPAFGGEFQPGTYRPTAHRKFANPAPLGLSAFALTTFVLSLVNMQARHVLVPNIVVGAAYGYGGLVQLLAGMWEMAVGNTFGATALSSYGGFWIAYAIISTPGGFDIAAAYGTDTVSLNYAVGFFLIGWFIFTTILVIATLRSTVAFFLLFFFLDITFLLLAIARFQLKDGDMNIPINKAGGFFGLLAAFMAWYNAMAGILDASNSFFMIPVLHFPWSEKGREARGKTPRETV
jgi:hypothetical protein